ncbi:MAG: Lrp/AsnC family transcriptional regulator [Euryarchaeota archaeon]|nr:Lrp/AsnC family transcriptional regulator [Euryarchaeota archaeon]
MHALKLKLDEKDKKIIALVLNNPKSSQKEIGDEVKLSQPSVASRLKRLRERGFVEDLTGMNLTKVGLYIAKVDITANNSAKIINTFKDCPFFLNALITSGKTNMCLFFVSENVATLEAIVNYHLRVHPGVQSIDFNIVISSAKEVVMPVTMNRGQFERSPCGVDIEPGHCPRYMENKCLGCPAIGHYKGKIW